MVYTATSTYEYITGDDLEAYTARTYLSADARYTEVVVMAQVSMAERIVNDYQGQTFTPPVDDDIKSAVLMIAKRLMTILMIEDGYFEPDNIKFELFIERILKKFLSGGSKKYDIQILSNITDDFFSLN